MNKLAINRYKLHQNIDNLRILLYLILRGESAMIKRIVYITSAIALSFCAESMNVPNLSFQMEQAINPHAQTIEADISDLEKKSIDSQLYMNATIFGAYKNPVTGEITIDMSYQNLITRIDCFLELFNPANRQMKDLIHEKMYYLRTLQCDVLADLCYEELFDLSLLPIGLCPKFAGLLKESAENPVGAERLKSLLITKWVFAVNTPRWYNGSLRNNDKIFIKNSDTLSVYMGNSTVVELDFDNRFRRGLLIGDTVSEEKGPLPLYITLLNGLSNVYHSQFFSMPLNACLASVLNDEGLRQQILPTHSQEIFSGMSNELYGLLLKAGVGVGNQERLSAYKKQIKSQKIVTNLHLPVYDLLSDEYDVSDIDYVRTMLAKILSVNSEITDRNTDINTVATPESPWIGEPNEILEIIGKMPCDIDGQKVTIIDRQNESAILLQFSNVYHLFNCDKLFTSSKIEDVITKIELNKDSLISAINFDMNEQYDDVGEAVNQYLIHILKKHIRASDNYCNRQQHISNFQMITPNVDENIFNLKQFNPLDDFCDPNFVPQTYFNFVIKEWNEAKLQEMSQEHTFLSLAINAGMPNSFIQRIINLIAPNRLIEILHRNTHATIRTPLELACIYGNMEILSMLQGSITKSAKSVKVAIDSIAFVISGIASEKAQIETINMLCNIILLNKSFHHSPKSIFTTISACALERAAYYKEYEVAKYFMQKCAALKVQFDAVKAIKMSCRYLDPEMFDILKCKVRANVKADDINWYLLQIMHGIGTEGKKLAVINKLCLALGIPSSLRQDVIKDILKKNNITIGGDTALHMAVRNKEFKIVECLLKIGIPADLPNIYGVLPIDIAKSIEMQSLLSSYQ